MTYYNHVVNTLTLDFELSKSQWKVKSNGVNSFPMYDCLISAYQEHMSNSALLRIQIPSDIGDLTLFLKMSCAFSITLGVSRGQRASGRLS